jgi:general stress protein 26
MTTTTDNQAKLWDLIKDIRFAMLTTRDAEGHLCARPVTTQNSSVDDWGKLWFFLSRKGEAVRELLRDPVVNVSYAEPSDDRYVSISGHAAVVEDQAKKEQLWSKLAEAYFPEGPDDPNLALVAVRIEHADYWDVKESKLVQLFVMAKAAITGKPLDDKLGEHGKVDMA